MYLPLWQRLLAIDSSEVLFKTRGFQSSSEMGHLEDVGRHFLLGYHSAFSRPSTDKLRRALEEVDGAYRGFAFEGAAMALWLQDSLSIFRRRRWTTFLHRTASHHPYIAHVGVGWAIARLPWTRRNPERILRRFDPLLRWLVLDGVGFHEGYFHTTRWIRPPVRQPCLSTYGNRVFDQGLGRSLWFVEGADVFSIAKTIETFEVRRRADLWSGVGLACAYAGRLSATELECLSSHSGPYIQHLRQGIAFGAEARVRADIASDHTGLVCTTVCGMDAESVARITQIAREGIDSESMTPIYEQWRSRTRELLYESIPALARSGPGSGHRRIGQMDCMT